MVSKKIGTHNGKFHSDEVLAIAMLRNLSEYENAEIIRTRDPALLNTCHIVVDVGTLFDPINHRYDHHQPTFTSTMQDFHPTIKSNLKLSSAGLIYAHFGLRILSQITSKCESDPEIQLLFKQLYRSFVSEIDAIDNGVPISESTPNYYVSTDLSSRVSRCNPTWNQPEMDENTCFDKALHMVESEFVERVKGLAISWIPARNIVISCFNNRFSVDPTGYILDFGDSPCPWKQHFFDIECEHLLENDEEISAEQPFKNRPVFVMSSRNDGSYGLCAIPISADFPFSKRVSLPLSWSGKRGDELDKEVGISGCVFVHVNQFLAIHKTFDGALEMAHRALKLSGYT